MNQPSSKLIRSIIAVILALGCQWAYASEHIACRDLDYFYRLHTADELRDIAASCHSKAIAVLYYNRAHHNDLLIEAETLSKLISGNRDFKPQSLVTYRVYIELIEQFAPIWFSDLALRAQFLNSEYSKYTEIMELNLRGYHNLANRLEQQAR